MKLLNNLSITSKSLISTLISALAVIAMAVLAMSSFVAFQNANDLQSKSTDLMSQARDAWIDLARGPAALSPCDQPEVAKRRGWHCAVCQE